MKWQHVELGNYVEIKSGKRMPNGAELVSTETPHPYIRARDIAAGKVEIVDAVFVPDSIYPKIRKYIVDAGNVCVTIVGANVGAVGQVPKSLHGANLTENAVRLVTLKGLNQDFLKYTLLTDSCQQQMKYVAGGAAQPKLGIYKIKRIRIPLPSLPIQEKIAKALSAYDDLIANNRRRIALLEEAVQQLYKEWFVRFHFPGHETTKMIKGIPAGWETMQVSDWLESHIGGGWGEDFLVEDHNEAGFVIRGTDLPQVALGQIDRVPFRFHKSSNLKSRTLSDGDLVFEVSGGSKGQPVGRSLLISLDILESFDSPVICASFFKKLRPAKREYAEYMNLHLQYIREVGYMDVFATQSASNITNFKFTAFLTQHSFLLPSQTVLQNFNAIVGPIYKQIRTLGRQNLCLAKARDLLLPRLMSGEINI